MELSLEMLNDAHEKNLKITEVPVDIRYDVPKSSSFTAFSHGLTVLCVCVCDAFSQKTTFGSRDTWPNIIRYLCSYGAQSCIRFHRTSRYVPWTWSHSHMDWCAWISHDGNWSCTSKCKKFPATHSG